MTLSLVSLFSGSGGNCTAVSCGDCTLLIDAGRSAKAIEQGLCGAGIDPQTLRAIFVTHEHIDHISALRVLTKKHPIPIYTARATAQALPRDCDRYVCGRPPVFEEHVGNMTVRSFPTSHDAACPLGYRIDADSGKEHISVGLVTDTGVVTDEIRKGLWGCRAVVLESNHDADMLKCGPYPPQLKQRVGSSRGHLSNADSAGFAAELAAHGTEKLILAHISKENNRPSLALDACQSRLAEAGLAAEVLTSFPDTYVGVSMEF